MNLNQEKEGRKFLNKEVVLVETPAQVKYKGNMLSGTLALTSNHLIFSTQRDGVKMEMLLSEINSVKIFQFLGFISKGIKCFFNHEAIIILVDYPRDWVRLILKQVKKVN